MTLRHHLVTVTNGKSLEKMNQRTNFALITFLVWILSFHSTSCNAFIFGVQAFQSPKTPSKINNALSFDSKSNKSFNNETVSTFQLVVISVTNEYLKGSTNNSPASIIEQLSVPNDGPASTIEQLSVSNDGPAHFKQHSVPMTAPQAFSATTATTTVIKTPVPTTMTATTKAILLKLDNCLLHPAKSAANHATPRNLLLFFVRNNPAIMIPSLLLPHDFEHSAIMMATHANLLLLPVRDGPASTVATLANFSLQLIVVIFCKISFHFCEDCRIFREGEYQVKNNGYAINK
jgi:hypothetical protein